jgi:outer membrane protein assembly factor BamB
VTLVLLVLFAFGQTAAPDWPQWRGPARNAVLPAGNVPASWPASWREAWRVEVGEGYSSPVVVAGRAFVHSRVDPREVVTAIDAASGKVIWQQQYDAAFTKNQYAVRMGKGPNATPLVTGGRVFTLGATGLLTAWDAASGRHLWRKNYSGQVDTSKLFCGTSASPLLAGGLVVVQVGSDIHGGRIAALDPATGETKWEWKGPGPGYASPVLIDAGGTSQLVTMTNGSIVGVDARTGAQLWTIAFPDEWHENIVTPLWTGSELIVAGVRQGTQAYRLSQVKGAWQATLIWKNADLTMYMSSPVFGDGAIYGLGSKRKGQFVALDPATGAVRWSTEGREGDHASVLLAPAHVLFLTSTGDLVVARRNPSAFELVKRYDVASAETWAMPVFLGSDLIVREAAHLVKLSAAN